METILTKRWSEWMATALIVLIYFFLRWLVTSLVARHKSRYRFDLSRSVYIQKSINFFLTVLLLIALFGVWNVETKSLYMYFGSFFTVAGVALFAQWSILSNITSSVILFFHFPFSIGSRIRILDKDDTVEGIVQDITFFTILIKKDTGEMVSYPNNVAMQKPIEEILSK